MLIALGGGGTADEGGGHAGWLGRAWEPWSCAKLVNLISFSPYKTWIIFLLSMLYPAIVQQKI